MSLTTGPYATPFALGPSTTIGGCSVVDTVAQVVLPFATPPIPVGSAVTGPSGVFAGGTVTTSPVLSVGSPPDGYCVVITNQAPSMSAGPIAVGFGSSLAPVSFDNPTAAYLLPASAVQIQNQSGATLTVTAGGQQWAVQSWTAQTLPLFPDGTGVTVQSNTADSTDLWTVTYVWLLTVGGQLDMAPTPDGSLTAFAA